MDLGALLHSYSWYGIGNLVFNTKLVFNSNIWPNSAALRSISLGNLRGLDIDLQGHSRSNVIVSFDSPYMVSY